ncbi:MULTISPECIES: anaerobic ribonucleoside-triphosphate reductase [Coprococcus]|jgi:anaerobic ribonucleoside-triphosphate reductase|uniref:Anaerobic ribonucleoside-triphosphate reductase n=1 Tax=Coprococcus comes TaxID=410072 RepID=A0A3E4GRT5_9FIRM|nr:MULTISPECIES: anaerobic ribonucleoside-triphosphate reductase [Coprococcus]MBS4935125.1 anaerobic ribonucleoside-triphosphate reductase [Coprococcus comes]MBU5249143.1 anaerobic ribonucleoside-triphosphate reductase [Coprococcus comes]NSF17328.1 anaerobic ribonucleoside-triphosphate reductase [Coprococcus comes]NUN85304.1 anaerobic ribonucleoside-triphosphate reductase [Coprococcus comes]RGJ24568.1 anaerobic ribonucleoside-triphosphate reductase [Coprococcus comes]
MDLEVKTRVIKRNGEEVDFRLEKIVNAIKKANEEVENIHRMNDFQIIAIAEKIAQQAEEFTHAVNVEDIQDMVETGIMEMRGYEVAQKYVRYRYKRELTRKSNTTDNGILALIDHMNEEVKQENSNKNPVINSTQRDYMAGEVSKDLTKRVLLPEEIVRAHEEGIIHFHDMDYFAQKEHNCDLINLEDMLQNGTVISETMIEKPHSFFTACNVTTQIVAQVASNQYGGQSFTLSHLAPFVDVSRQKLRKSVIEERIESGEVLDDAIIDKITERRLRTEVQSGIQTIQYQLITLMTCNGQAPFVTVFMYLDEVPEGRTRDDLAMIIEEVMKQRMQGVKNEKGVWITPAFPKLIYVLDEDNITEDSKYWYLTELAAKCTAKRMVPDYISAKIMKELKNGDVYPCMGCRSFLTVEDSQRNADGSHKFYGRFNQGVVTINLVDVACSAEGNMERFWEILDERLELCHRALRCRHERLLGTVSDVAPILWQNGALARLKKGETIDKLLFDGYSTISLGYAGLYEMCMRMLGKSHTDPEAKPFALAVMQRLNDKCKEWKEAENISYSVYGTPMESTTYKFAKCLQKRFGIIPGVTDKNYITNSYHVHVTEEIDAFSKLKFESEFQKLSPGGAISYIEVPNMQTNIPAVLSVLQYIYENIMYAELNTKSDFCEVCGYDGEIKIIEDETGKLVWECPNCGNRDQDKLFVARRTCGYIGTQFWNQGRTQEIKDRVLHL